MNTALPPFVVDEDGKLMNYLKRSGNGKEGGNALTIPRPYAYYCFVCDNVVAWMDRVNMDCHRCGDPRFLRVVRSMGHGKTIVVWQSRFAGGDVISQKEES